MLIKRVHLLLAAPIVWLGAGLAWPGFTARESVAEQLRQALREVGSQPAASAKLSEADRRALQAALQAEMPEPRWKAARILGEWRDRDSVSALLVALRDEDGTRRTCLMAQALGHIGDSAAVPELLWASRHPSNVDLRMCALHALAEIGDERAVAPLVEQARSASEEQDRMAALAALGDLGCASAEPALRASARDDPSATVRERALDALWQINLLRDDAVARLVGALGRHEHWVHDEWILRELARRWNDRCAAPLNRYAARADTLWQDRLRVCALLRAHANLQSATLVMLATSEDRDVRLLAAELRQAPRGSALIAGQ